MKIAIVDICWKELHGPDPLSESLGGSETWLVQISREFARQENQVSVYCWTENEFLYENVKFLPEKNFLECKEKYDFVILNRFFQKGDFNYIKYIRDNELAKHVYLQIHDLSLMLNGRLFEEKDNPHNYYLDTDFITIVTLNSWHRSNFIQQYPSTRDNCSICIPNGLDLSLFKEYNFKRDNRILWSSCMDRGVKILIDDIYPIVKAEIPDFGIDIARYNDDHSVEFGDKDVKLIGKLTKEELYKEQSKHKLWFYPGTFAETFCITMIENIMNGCQVVSPLTYGTNPTFGKVYARKVKMNNNFANNYNEAVKEAAQKIISILKTDGQRPEVYNYVVEKIKNEYNWINSVNLYTNHFNGINKKKILILTMSCNNPYFKALLSAVKDTWVKPIIHGDYQNIYWFSYTSCDKKHPHTYIDWKDHMIYVECSDDIYSTFEKTKLAYDVIKNTGIEFDYVVRTNTTVYINIDTLVSKINSTQDDECLGGLAGYYHKHSDNTYEFKWNIMPGLFMGMSKEYFDIAMSATNNYDSIPTTDDVIISGKLHEVFGDFKCVSPNPDCPTVYPRYKAYLPGDEKMQYGENPELGICGTFIDDPDVINKNTVIQIRTMYTGSERSEKGHELEHLYELYEAQN